MADSILEVMTANPTALAASMTIGDAARTMRDRGIGDVMVLDENRALCGIVTDRDIVVRAVAEDRSPGDVRLGDICSRDLTTIDMGASLEDAAHLMSEKALRRLPVLDNGRPAGIVSLGDLAIHHDRSSALSDISSVTPNT